MNAAMLKLIACPICRGALEFNAQRNELVCRAERLAYPVADGIPMLLPEHAKPLATPSP